ncbi:MAG: dynamin family protein [Pseudomonadota bacterium]
MTLDLNESRRTPRIAIMGEFSAGKSTLCNLLMRTRALPERVTATRLAPVWITKGPGQDVRVTHQGEEIPVDINTLDTISFEGTRYIRLHLDADILDHCDFIDFPGISDPNMDAEVWEDVLTEADAVIWLTHATQAWRQSEAAVWDTVPEAVRDMSVLLVSRFDKLTSDQDRARVLSRLDRETQGLFNCIFPIALIDAVAAGEDYDAWTESGAAAFMDHLVDLIGSLEPRAAVASDPDRATEPSPLDTPQEEQALTTAEDDDAQAEAPVTVTTVGPARPDAPMAPRIVPRRVKPSGMSRRPRPEGLRA